jgi:hypothetical protein
MKRFLINVQFIIPSGLKIFFTAMAADTLSVPSPRSDFYRSCGLSIAIVAANTSICIYKSKIKQLHNYSKK